MLFIRYWLVRSQGLGLMVYLKDFTRVTSYDWSYCTVYCCCLFLFVCFVCLLLFLFVCFFFWGEVNSKVSRSIATVKDFKWKTPCSFVKELLSMSCDHVLHVISAVVTFLFCSISVVTISLSRSGRTTRRPQDTIRRLPWIIKRRGIHNWAIYNKSTIRLYIIFEWSVCTI